MDNGVNQFFSGRIHAETNTYLKGALTGWFISAMIIAGKENIFNEQEKVQEEKQKLKQFYDELTKLFEKGDDFLNKVHQLDEFIDNNQELQDIRELLLDLMFFNFFKTNPFANNTHFLESEEWEKTEEQLEGRGSPMVDIFLYLSSAKNENKSPNLNDFLEKFLLINEPGFEEESEIYMEIIEHKGIVREEITNTFKAAGNLESIPPEELPFLPVMLFFNEQATFEQKTDCLEEPSLVHPFLMSGFMAILSGYHGYQNLPEKWQLLQ